jgi:L-asparaginase II
VMALLGERLFCKVGAEGVHGAALPELGLGVAIKIDDGNTARACEVAQAAVVQALLAKALSDGEQRDLAVLADLPLVNWNGIEVGRLQAAPALRALAAP